jgi:putative ABC transport system permease protein
LLNDLRFALRMLRTNTGFTAIAVLALALGIGANTAIFSVANELLLRPLPFPHAEQLVRVWESYGSPGNTAPVSYPNFRDWRAWNQSFAELAAFSGFSGVLTGSGEPLHLQGVIASANLFRLLGAQPVLGRAFLDQEDQPHANRGADSVVISHRLWSEHFGGDPDILGKSLALDGALFTVVGVAAPQFDSHTELSNPDFWVTAAVLAEPTPNNPKLTTEERDISFLGVMGRLKPGVTIAQAQADMKRVSEMLVQAYPKANPKAGTTIVGLQQTETGDIQPALLVLLGAAGVVLLIACADVGGLVLVRVTRRQREMTVRVAMGAARWRIVRQLLVESLVLAAIGGGAGLWLASIAARPLGRILGMGESAQPAFDSRVLAFCVASATLAAVIFSLAPILHASKTDLMNGLKESSTSAGGSRRQKRLQNAMLIGQMALAMVLLTSAGLLTLSLMRLQKTDLGFEPRQVLTFPVSLPEQRYPQTSRAAFFQDLTERLRLLPGVQSASAGGRIPFRGGTSRTVLDNVAGRDIPLNERRGIVFSSVTPDHFRTLRIPVLRGREFTGDDSERSLPVVMINEAAARFYFGTQDPLGKQIQPLMWNGSGGTTQPRTIVGIVGNIKSRSVIERPEPYVYWPVPQIPSEATMYVSVRTAGDPMAIAKSAESVLHAIDRDLPMYGANPLPFFIADSLKQPRRNTALVALFAGLALVLSAVGLYGVIAYSVTRRTREIGIRLALGASGTEVLRAFVRQGFVMCAAGIGIGLPGAIAAARGMRSLLLGMSAPEPWVFAASAGLLAAVALLASFIPARRATNVDPMIALRWE